MHDINKENNNNNNGNNKDINKHTNNHTTNNHTNNTTTNKHILNKYKILKIIGAGASSTVYLSYYNYKYYAIKIIPIKYYKIYKKEVEALSKLNRECNICYNSDNGVSDNGMSDNTNYNNITNNNTNTNHSNYIIKMYEYATDKHNCYIVLERCYDNLMHYNISNRYNNNDNDNRYRDDGNNNHTNNTITNNTTNHTTNNHINIIITTDIHMVSKISRMLLLSVYYIHSKGYIHRDIKPSNILITEKEIKISDFGLCTKEKEPKSICGTKDYIAPEILYNNNRYDDNDGSDRRRGDDSNDKRDRRDDKDNNNHININNKYNKEVDLYSIGLVIYYILHRKKYNKDYTYTESDNRCDRDNRNIYDKDYINTNNHTNTTTTTTNNHITTYDNIKMLIKRLIQPLHSRISIIDALKLFNIKINYESYFMLNNFIKDTKLGRIEKIDNRIIFTMDSKCRCKDIIEIIEYDNMSYSDRCDGSRSDNGKCDNGKSMNDNYNNNHTTANTNNHTNN
ncbi:Serine/threonine protein kinase, partial [Spraguea lophii 42_110]